MDIKYVDLMSVASTEGQSKMIPNGCGNNKGGEIYGQ